MDKGSSSFAEKSGPDVHLSNLYACFQGGGGRKKEGEGAMTDRAKIAEKMARRAWLEAELGARQRALPDKRYGVIYADPPWRFEPYSRITGMDRAAENHYPTSPLAEIKALDVKSIAAPDCVLFLWATVPMLAQALEVMTNWGFGYKSHAIWAKDRVGMGYWFRNQHEMLLVGTRGHVPAPAMGKQGSSLILGLVRRHSEKPEIFRQMIESYFPTLPKIELHARGSVARTGWDVWGLEAPMSEDHRKTESQVGEMMSPTFA
jgi:N6-adenosine-specific RNA methylase IME4